MILLNSIISAPDKCYQHISGTSQNQSLGEIRVMPTNSSQFSFVPQTKICKVCQVEKKSSFFYQYKGRIIGDCKECTKAKRKEEYATNPEKIKQKNLESHFRHRVKRLADQAIYRENNKEKISGSQKLWWVNNRETKLIERRAKWHEDKEKRKEAIQDITVDRVRELFSYEEHTGIITNKTYRGAYALKGSEAGGIHPSGYLKIRIDGKHYFAHRVAWLYFYGVPPVSGIDHINGNKLDNRMSNLREANQKQNGHNRRVASVNNKLGFLGVYQKRNKFVASIRVDGKLKQIGTFLTPEEAHEAYLKAKRQLHEFCTI